MWKKVKNSYALCYACLVAGTKEAISKEHASVFRSVVSGLQLEWVTNQHRKQSLKGQCEKYLCVEVNPCHAE